MSSSFWLLGVTDFSQAEKERTAGKPEQIHKMTTIFTQNGPGLSFWAKIVVILWSCSALQAASSLFLSLRKITLLNTQQPKTRGHVEHISRDLMVTLHWLHSGDFTF